MLAAVVLTIVLLPSSDETQRYDLDSAQPDGYRGLRLLLEETGTDVDRVDADDVTEETPADTVFVPDAAGAGGEQVARWRRYAEAGNTLVLGSPVDGLGAPASDVGFSGVDGTCSVDGLAGDEDIVIPFVDTGVEVGADDGCFGDGESALIVGRFVGDGEIITLATPDLFTNTTMGAPEPDQPVGRVPDNAVVAQVLLGTPRLAVVTSGVEAVGVDGEKGLTDFMSPGVKLGILELGVAFGFYAVARGRRHGRVVTEPLPVTIAGSAFVEAVGSLLERQGDHARTAEVLREGECRRLALRLGLPRSMSRHDLAAVVAERTGRDRAEVERLLTQPVDSETALVEITRELDSLRQEALHV